MGTLYDCVLTFCEATLEAVKFDCIEEEEDSTRENTKECLLEMLEMSINYLDLVSNDEAVTLRCTLWEILVILSNKQENREQRRGRPKIVIARDRLLFLRDCGFKMNDISVIFGCSRRTVERRLLEYDIPRQCDMYASITNAELDEKVLRIVSMFPMCGQKSVDGRLKSEGLRMSRKRIRESLRRVDPFGVESRARGVLRRRRYHVDSPNDLWHIDGYHKLIRWRLVIHGGIDGFSRLIMFLKVSSNNRAETMFQAFEQGVTEFGLPSRIRMDKGGENVEVARYIVEERGVGHAIAGRSVHNQRIERLWRDLFSGCISFFYYSFYFLEDCGLLDIQDERDIYALHFSFLGVIQDQLNNFMLGWSNHGLRTEHGKSPMQLWVSGLLQTRTVNPEHEALSGLHEVGVNLCLSHNHFLYIIILIIIPIRNLKLMG